MPGNGTEPAAEGYGSAGGGAVFQDVPDVQEITTEWTVGGQFTVVIN